MKKIFPVLITIFLTVYQVINCQDTPAEKGLAVITPDAIKAQMNFLASDWTEGREAGERGEYLAGDYIASLLQLYGIKPGGDYPRIRGYMQSGQETARTFFQNFTILKTTPGEVQTFKVKSIEGTTTNTSSFERNIDFMIRSQDKSIEIEAPVIFIGYGFKNDRIRYNDFSNIELKGKFILKLAGMPGYAKDRLTQDEISSSARETEDMLRQAGIAGIIEFTPGAKTAGFRSTPEFLNMSPSENRQRAGMPYARYSLPGKTDQEGLIRVIVSEKIALEILRGTGIDIDSYIKKAESGKPGVSLQISSKTIYLRSDLNTTPVQVRNIIGVVEGNDPDQVIVLGAHYDHMGMSNGYIWNGADDNASGTVGVMTIAKAVMETGKKPEKTIIFALWTAEEKGLLGSQYYVNNLSYPLKNLRLNINFDMISRYIADDNPDGVIMSYTASCQQFKSITENNLKKYGINLTVDYQGSENPSGPSDESTFVNIGIPIIRFKTAHREEYHTPDDETGTVDWDIMEKIIKISFTNVWELANSEW